MTAREKFVFTRRDFIRRTSLLGLGALNIPFALKVFLEFQALKKPLIGGTIPALYYEKLENNKIKCTLCPNFHIYKPGERSFCFTRVNQGGVLMSYAYNNPCIISIDPIEKGPFNHFLPDTNALSIALGGCNLRCLYCQNWQMAMESPEKVAKCNFTREDCLDGAREKECQTICYTYTEPAVYPEYVKEVADYTRAKGIRNVACTSGFINPQPLKDLCKVIDAFAVTLKAFNNKFYQKICGQSLTPVLNSLEIIKKEGRHLEIINLVVPSYNDDMDVIKQMCQWIKKNLGEDTPLHIGRFYPEYKLKDLPATPIKTIESARNIGFDEGLKYVYTFNVAPHEGNNTFCPSCKKPVIKRLAFKVLENNLTKGKCNFCGYKIAGVF
ncbi:MAG: AmmeMemoRadiSam system radical SAM enzyme [Planctomycetota bacterium]|nr:AmmeMemoRadiSam system radical SAM enzyme [Planctomycetota bacterium]MDI6787030.1 AmmeMemoRadiSam system radical SAM enzyme [Planctomycetota bacterium]